MKLLIIGTEDIEEHVQLRAAAQELGHSATSVRMADIVFNIWDKSGVFVNGERIDTTFDTLYFRAFNPHFSDAIHLAEWCAEQGMTVIADGLEERIFIKSKAYEIWKLQNAGLPTPKTFHGVSAEQNLARLESASYPLIIKSIHGSHGKHVFKCDTIQEAKEVLETDFERMFVLQEFLDIQDEYRAFVIGGKFFTAMRRDDVEGDFRRNASLGSTGTAVTLPEEVIQLAEQAAAALERTFGGIDLVRLTDGSYRVLEVNRNPGFKELERATGAGVANAIIKYIISKTENR